MDIIYLDFDGTISDTNQAAVDYYNDKTNSNIKVEDIKEFSFLDIMPKWNKEQIDNMFIKEEFFEKYMKPIDGCIDVLRRLKSEGYSFRIATIHNPKGIIYKDNWIKKYLGDLIDGVTYITFNTTELTMDKSSLHGLCLVDDNVSCLESCTEIIYPICFGNYNYNSEWQGRKAHTWEDFYGIVKDIENELESIGG